MDRKTYWDSEYFKYWKQRVDELKISDSESKVVKGDVKTGDEDLFINTLDNLLFPNANLLEVGCAWGRWFDLYIKHHLNIYGIDISDEMIKQAKLRWGNERNIKSLLQSEAEKIPYPDNYFDFVVCYGVFDATYQDNALSEMLRVLKMNGKLCLTGKNYKYDPNDELAEVAEINARNKEHPNYFTNTDDMISQLEHKGHKISESFFYPTRESFSDSYYLKSKPEYFYLYFLIISKKSYDYNFKPFSYEYSLNCMKF
ncbi:MAG: class I SAM-dependent methyltransferase [Desulfobacterales bacterium]|nr:class I SAM-dependent methyltransferase [Desulfobacterales bacterium]